MDDWDDCIQPLTYAYNSVMHNFTSRRELFRLANTNEGTTMLGENIPAKFWAHDEKPLLIIKAESSHACAHQHAKD